MDEEFLPDEFVVEDEPTRDPDANVIFTGASDPPPLQRGPAITVRSPRPSRAGTYVLAVAAGAVWAAALSVFVLHAAGPRPIPSAVAAAAAQDEARVALDEARTSAAIEAARRAVTLDPSDAGGWLLLGAAYDQSHAYARARDAFAECVRVATRGPRGECGALLR